MNNVSCKYLALGYKTLVLNDVMMCEALFILNSNSKNQT